MDTSMMSIALSTTVALLSVFVLGAIRRLYFHPLSRFPGPKLAALSNYPYSSSFLGGRQPWDILKLHNKYGTAIRVSPNELSFSSGQSWTDIYAPRKGNELIKSAFYDGGNFADQAHSIVSERNPEKHAQMKKFLSRAFSEQSLREQEGMISKVINRFIERVGQVNEKEGSVDLTKWFNLMTFDIIGLLAFGQDFEGVESGITHQWIEDVQGSMSQATTSDTLSRFPWLGKLYMLARPDWLSSLMAASLRHQTYTMKITKERINELTKRKDFMAYLLSAREGISDVQFAAHASDFVIAGSETTATTLTVVLYYLCLDPCILQRVRKEISDTFKTYEEIDGLSTARLRYQHAVCLEALRIFPPLPLGLPRVVPEGGALIDGLFVPGGFCVSTNPFAASMSSRNFLLPEQFRPERWLEEGVGGDSLDASRPFSLGNRSCLGRSLAWLELHITLTRLLFRYDISADGVVDWHGQSEMHLLWKKPEIRVKLVRKSQ